MSGTPEHQTWMDMKGRCNNPNDPQYKNYGARGITVCPEWESMAQFFADMGPRPSPRHSLDRIDNSQGYSPANCAWATSKQQGRNRRGNRQVSFQGRTQTLSAWSEEVGIDYATLHGRLKSGWTVEQALTTEPGTRNRWNTHLLGDTDAEGYRTATVRKKMLQESRS